LEPEVWKTLQVQTLLLEMSRRLVVVRAAAHHLQARVVQAEEPEEDLGPWELMESTVKDMMAEMGPVVRFIVREVEAVRVQQVVMVILQTTEALEGLV
jgi:hypothetical protein